MLENGVEKRFEELADKDVNGPEAARDIKDLRRLVLMYLHLGKLLQNFVSFVDFYSLGESVTFRAGTLYIDGRSCKLCVPAADLAAHSRMASLSQLPLLYCQCTRRSNAAEKRLIMAAVTAGSEDYLVEGRNGVFVDNEGNDWDAVLVKIIHNPISIRQAVWAPYKRLRQMAGDAIAKYAASKANTALADAAKLAKTPDAKAPAGGGFDIGKSAGIFAAVGLALGALGTAVGQHRQRPFLSDLVAVPPAHHRHLRRDFRTVCPACVAQAAQAQPCPRAGSLRLGRQFTAPHQSQTGRCPDPDCRTPSRRGTPA